MMALFYITLLVNTSYYGLVLGTPSQSCKHCAGQNISIGIFAALAKGLNRSVRAEKSSLANLFLPFFDKARKNTKSRLVTLFVDDLILLYAMTIEASSAPIS